MSTICKLDPRIRRDRAARRDLLRAMPDEINTLIHVAPPGSRMVERAIAASHLLEQIAASPWRTGIRKQALFTHIAQELARDQGVQLPRP